jgi:hypothetical protein
MNDKNPRPAWWLLFLSPFITFGLFVLEMQLSLSETEHRLLELLILLGVFGGIWLWLKANTRALILEDMERWQTASKMASEPVPAQSEEIVRTNGNLNRQPRPVWKPISTWLIALAAGVSGFFH